MQLPLQMAREGAPVEILHASPVNTTGVQTPDLIGCVQDDSVFGAGWNQGTFPECVGIALIVDSEKIRGADQRRRPAGRSAAQPLRQWRSIYFPGGTRVTAKPALLGWHSSGR